MNPRQPVLITRRPAVKRAVEDRVGITRHYQCYRPEILRGLQRGTRVIGSLPVPIAATICAAGHHYEHVVIPNASSGPEALTYRTLSRNMQLVEFHVGEIE